MFAYLLLYGNMAFITLGFGAKKRSKLELIEVDVRQPILDGNDFSSTCGANKE